MECQQRPLPSTAAILGLRDAHACRLGILHERQPTLQRSDPLPDLPLDHKLSSLTLSPDHRLAAVSWAAEWHFGLANMFGLHILETHTGRLVSTLRRGEDGAYAVRCV